MLGYRPVGVGADGHGGTPDVPVWYLASSKSWAIAAPSQQLVQLNQPKVVHQPSGVGAVSRCS